jgi:hypothetical protein
MQSSYQSLGIVDEIDRARAHEYALLATLLSRSLDAELISRLALLGGRSEPDQVAHTALGEALPHSPRLRSPP